MATMNNPKSFLEKLDLESAKIDGVQFVRDPEGVWRYASNGIPVPGARDVTLTERFDPRLIIRSDGEIERVVIDGSSIEAAGDLLDWCLDVGSLVIEGDRLVEVLVPYSEWLERDRIPGELIAPEFHGTEQEQELAVAERTYREAEQAMEFAAEGRAQVLRRLAVDMTRQEARAITGLSVGRIQQLIRSDLLEAHERQILEIFEGQAIEGFAEYQAQAENAGLPGDKEVLMDAVKELENRGYLEWVDGTGEILTGAGAQALYVARQSASDNEDD